MTFARYAYCDATSLLIEDRIVIPVKMVKIVCSWKFWGPYVCIQVPVFHIF